jgi:hypothetical protein
VIAEVGTGLRGLFGPLLPGVTLRFGGPAEPATPPAVCFFLAEVREDARAAPADWDDIRDEHGRVRARRPPAHPFDLRYLVTAYAKTVEREEELLDVVLAAAAPAPRLNPALLKGTLADPEYRVVLGMFPDAGQLWSRLHLPARTVLGLQVNAPLVGPLDTDIAKPAAEFSLGVARGASVPPAEPSTVDEPKRWRRARIDEH